MILVAMLLFIIALVGVCLFSNKERNEEVLSGRNMINAEEARKRSEINQVTELKRKEEYFYKQEIYLFENSSGL